MKSACFQGGEEIFVEEVIDYDQLQKTRIVVNFNYRKVPYGNFKDIILLRFIKKDGGER